MKRTHTFLAVLGCLFLFGFTAQASPGDDDKINALKAAIASLEAPGPHCEVPCGIYGDSLRVALINEHITTVEKAMKQINEISESEKPNYNQLVRWVMNKEKHAEEIQQIVSQYFLHQRIKMPKNAEDRHASKHYTDNLKSLHAILVHAMKSKQKTDVGVIDDLRAAVSAFEHSYFEHKH